MGRLAAAVIAAGSQGRVHLHGYLSHPDVDVVAIADPDLALATEVADANGVPHAYASAEELLAAHAVDIVSVCAPPLLHRAVVETAVRAGVRAVHCEKPVAPEPADVRAMRELCSAAGVQFTVNHQRRLESVFTDARDLIGFGAIGGLVSIEAYCSNLFDWGSHILDLILFFAGDEPPETVFGQIDVDRLRRIYGALTETASVTHLHWRHGLNAVVFTGRGPEHLAASGSPGIVLHGTEGRIELAGSRAVVRTFAGERSVLTSRIDPGSHRGPEGVDPSIVQATADGIADLVDALVEGREPLLDARHAAAAAELVFATYESSAVRGSVRLPLLAPDSALLRGLREGFWAPVGETAATF